MYTEHEQRDAMRTFWGVRVEAVRERRRQGAHVTHIARAARAARLSCLRERPEQTHEHAHCSLHELRLLHSRSTTSCTTARARCRVVLPMRMQLEPVGKAHNARGALVSLDEALGEQRAAQAVQLLGVELRRREHRGDDLVDVFLEHVARNGEGEHRDLLGHAGGRIGAAAPGAR